MGTYFALALLSIAFLAYRRERLWVFTAVLFGIGALAGLKWGATPAVVLGYWLPLLPVALVLNVRPLRRIWISAPLRRMLRRRLGNVPALDGETLEAGTAGWDAELFTGKPDWKGLLALPASPLRPDERAYLEGPLEALCHRLALETAQDHWDLSDETWAFLRQQKMLGLAIPRAWGGLEFSNRGVSAVLQRLAAHSPSVAISVMVPNTLAINEMLVLYGTREQKAHHLPRLARGEDLACLALTEPYAGSDIGGLNDAGHLVQRPGTDGGPELGFEVDFDKRYVTMATRATHVGLAFRAIDPDHLLGKARDLGITCALLPVDTPGIERGFRHRPTGVSLASGPMRGRGVFVPLEAVIGGKDRIGQGHRMLQTCLASGRAVASPSLAVAGAKLALASSSAYARLRQQFDSPLSRFEGISEILADMAARCYRMDAALDLTLRALDQGQRPAILASVLKVQLAEDHHRCLSSAMQIQAGKAVMEGPANTLADSYQALPTALTIEGTQVITRSLEIFGLGAFRCHPFLVREIRASLDPDPVAGLREFDISLFGHIGFAISNGVRAVWLALNAGRLSRPPLPGPLERQAKLLKRLSAAFAVIADLLLVTRGPRIRQMQRLSGRMADVLSHLYLASAVLKRFHDQGQAESERELAELALYQSLSVIQIQMSEALRNFPSPRLGRILGWLLFPWGRPAVPPSDARVNQVAALVTRHSVTRQRLIEGIDVDASTPGPLGRLEHGLALTLQSEMAAAALRNALGKPVTPLNVEALVERGLQTGIITAEQAEQVRAAQAAVRDIIQVDEFPIPEVEGVRNTGST